MISYELAKQLKEAGFTSTTFMCGHPDVWTAPYLHELIEACPKTKNDRGVLTIKWLDDQWCAGYDFEIDYDENDFCILGEGKTPEEAVAKLWLQLNPKT